MKTAKFSMYGAIATALLPAALGMLPPNVWAQKVYRCGTVYSQTPCEGAVTVDVNDSRTQAQQREAEQAAQRDGKSANTLETRRLQEEKQVAARDAAARKEVEQRRLAEKRAAAEEEKAAAHHAKPPKKARRHLNFLQQR